METGRCPICECAIPLVGLERHVNAHLDQAQCANDHALAWELASGSPAALGDFSQVQRENEEIKEECGSKRHITSKSSGNASILIDVDILAANQVKGAFKLVDGGIMNLLRDCLYLESHHLSSTVISGYIDHFESCTSEDVGWGCGWRNIQMMSSHLMSYSWGKNALFGGVGFVPDITSLQRWLEVAWSFGFDVAGAEYYQYKIYGSREWIGTTECAALFRFFGLRARIVDFSACNHAQVRNGQTLIERWVSETKPTISQLSSISPVHLNVGCDICGVYPIQGTRFQSKILPDYDLCSACFLSNNVSLDDYETLETSTTGSATGNRKLVACDEDVNHELLVKWLWRYFTGGIKDSSLRAHMDRLEGFVLESECTPLYFQHQGHSRTIIGMQRRKKRSGGKEDIFLLVLDPSCRTEELAQSLKSKRQWQRLIKRSVHTLKKQSYQVCYVEPGIAQGEERDKLKILTGELVSI